MIDREQFEKDLVKKCPNLYSDITNKVGLDKSLMSFGLEVSEGWFKIIEDLSIKLEAEILKLPEDEREGFSAVQVKEKFAGLRFYMHRSNDAMDELIRKAEELSEVTCEVCGEFGSLRQGGWWRTLCDYHHENRNSKHVN